MRTLWLLSGVRYTDDLMIHDLVNDPHNLFVPDPPKVIPHLVFKFYDDKGRLVSETSEITGTGHYRGDISDVLRKGINIPDGGSCTVLFGDKAVSFFTSEWGTVYLGDKNGNHC